jgi:hypothetical protein
VTYSPGFIRVRTAQMDVSHMAGFAQRIGKVGQTTKLIRRQAHKTDKTSVRRRINLVA